jgi:D-glycero-D-manno-heptose 1,7-bisphosphate phosphatase
VRPALFLDRDGVINVDHGHVHKIEDFEFIPGIFDLVRKANQAEWLVIIVTNQAGIAKGYYTEEAFHTLMHWVCEQFLQNGARIDAVYHCPHHPEYGDNRNCNCRKPQPGLILNAARDFEINLYRSIMIGDKESDITAAAFAKIPQTYLVVNANLPCVNF